MKLLTHNFLSSNFLKNAEQKGYPLKLTVEEIKVLNVPLNMDYLRNIMMKVNYEVLWNTANGMGESEGLPVPDGALNLDSLTPQEIEKVHRVVECLDVVQGVLECPVTGRFFPIKDGIPNMLVNEDEMD